jgi:peptidoglycan/LPS O-acetylase OafA/YrhL
VLLSPIVLPIFRRFPVPTLLIPYAGIAVITLAGLHPHPVLHDLALYGGPWLLGFAHHDGKLRGRRLPWLAAVLAVAGACWVLTHPGPRGYDLNDIPLGNALWSAAFVLVALRFAPRIPAHRLLTVLNARALTVYLWHVPILVLVDDLALARGWPIFGAAGIGWRLPVVFALVAVAVLLVGWVEDAVSGRRPALVPDIVGPTEQDGRHDRHSGTGPPHVLRPRVREHAGRVADLGSEHDLPAGRGAEQLRGVRR